MIKINLEDRVEILERKLELLISYLEQVRRVADISIVSKEQLLSIIEEAAKQTKAEQKRSKEKTQEKEQAPIVPQGKKITVDDINLDGKYFFILNNWIANQKNVPRTIVCNVAEVTTKAVQIKYAGKEIWLPKSQIKEVWREEDFA